MTTPTPPLENAPRAITLWAGNDEQIYYVLDIAQVIFPFAGYFWLVYGNEIVGKFTFPNEAHAEMKRLIRAARDGE